jgi:hypothetical protein
MEAALALTAVRSSLLTHTSLVSHHEYFNSVQGRIKSISVYSNYSSSFKLDIVSNLMWKRQMLSLFDVYRKRMTLLI